MEMESGSKRKGATFKQAIEINDALRDRILPLGGGMCRYRDENDSDQSVADALGVNPKSVANVRYQMYGNLKRHHLSDTASNEALRGAIRALLCLCVRNRILPYEEISWVRRVLDGEPFPESTDRLTPASDE